MRDFFCWAVVAAAGTALLAGCGSPATENVGAPGQSSSAASASPTGVAFELYTHCGIRGTQFDGRNWQAVSPTTSPPAVVGADGTVAPQGGVYTRGTMTMVRTDLLRFSYAGGSAEFTPASEPPAPCA